MNYIFNSILIKFKREKLKKQNWNGKNNKKKKKVVVINFLKTAMTNIPV